ncbi:DNA (cytosine-5-)-methyltransferase [Bengtsoniella intestinalis]|uniref:DNA (cytosine-5-)-methyltransferase n=1 Tax=Bengtsoniella intestinalis TaxID=3073143 RepID=UPI00391EFF78
MSDLKVASLFAGIGGICLGFRQAGFEVVWANERDHKACNTYRKNWKDTSLVEEDISKIDPHTIPDFDVLVAGFPCQPFSTAGKQRGFSDPRGNLFFEIARIADIKKPSVIFLENVANLQEHDKGRTFLTIYNTLVELGYVIRYRIMTSMRHGNIPQLRNRIFIVAFLDEGACQRFVYPEEIPLERTIHDIVHSNIQQHEIYYCNAEIQQEFASQIIDQDSIYQMTDWGLRKNRNHVCPTLTAFMGMRKGRVPMVRDDFGIRYLTLRECLDFQGFPETFKFPNTIQIQDAYKQIGNSVTVPVIRRIAENLFTVMQQ